ncbi:MAG: biotin/lipoyl-containing protein [bacterium]
MAYIAIIDDKEYKIEIERTNRVLEIYLPDRKVVGTVISFNNKELFLVVDHRPYLITFDAEGRITVNGEEYNYSVADENVLRLLKTSVGTVHKTEAKVLAPMPGLVIEVEIKEGDTVKKGQGLLIIEAMKMQNEMKSPRDGVVKKVFVQKGQTVNSRDVLIIIE